MTNSRSKASISNWFTSIALSIAVLGIWAGVADAGGRKRVVVLAFEGPKADRFHSDLVKLLKKTHTVIPIDKWNGIAEELDAGNLDAKSLKKVAKKLKVDAIVSGKIEKRRDEYLVKIKLRAGKSGELVGDGFDTKADGPRLDGRASKDIKNELIDAIDGLGSNRDSGGDEEADEDRPSKKKPGKQDEDDESDRPIKKGMAKQDEDEEDKPSKKKPGKKDEADEDRPVKKGFGKKDEVDEDKPGKKGFARKKNDEETASAKVESKKVEPKKVVKKDEEEEDSPLPTATKKRPKKSDEEDADPDAKVATKDTDKDEEDGTASVDSGPSPLEAGLALTPANRAVDVVAGLSVNARRLGFSYDGDLANKPPGYKGVPVAGLLIDATVYPLDIGHKRAGVLRNVGLTLMYDKVLLISSKFMGMSLPTSESRFAIGGAFRYPIGNSAMAPVVGASLRFGSQSFEITGTVDVPNVSYTIVDPSISFKYPATPKIIFNASLGYMVIVGTGAIQKPEEYGGAAVSGFEGEFGGDYMLTKNLFARAAFKFEAISLKFNGTGAKTTNRDADPAQDVQGANDNYLGGAVTVGYLY